MTKSYQIYQDMDIETMPHAMYFTGDSDTVTKINHVLYQTIEYNDNGMFTTKSMNDTPIEIFIDNSVTPSILPLHTYRKFPIPLKLQHQTIQIKALVCDSECPYDLILG